MPYDRIGLEKVEIDGEERFVIKLLDRQLRNPFMRTGDALSKEEAVKQLRKMDVPEHEIQKMLTQAEDTVA